ncbi:MAG TPA: PqqD family protein [Anaerolineales bacterium]|nr:PqqD family protein [Anaerolineales bacterium]
MTKPVTLSQTFAPKPGLVVQILGQEAVLVHPERGRVQVFNAVGSYIWKLLDGHNSLKQVVVEIEKTYGISAERAQSDVLAFCHQLLVRDLIVVHENEDLA